VEPKGKGWAVWLHTLDASSSGWAAGSKGALAAGWHWGCGGRASSAGTWGAAGLLGTEQERLRDSKIPGTGCSQCQPSEEDKREGTRWRHLGRETWGSGVGTRGLGTPVKSGLGGITGGRPGVDQAAERWRVQGQ